MSPELRETLGRMLRDLLVPLDRGREVVAKSDYESFRRIAVALYERGRADASERIALLEKVAETSARCIRENQPQGHDAERARRYPPCLCRWCHAHRAFDAFDAASSVSRHPTFDELLDRSSLGTPEAKAIRAQADPADVTEVLRRADKICPECLGSGDGPFGDCPMCAGSGRAHPYGR